MVLPGASPTYLFSKSLNWLDFDPSYPKSPKTLGDYIVKLRKDKGISQVDLARRIGVNEMTVVNWEIKGRVPYCKYLETLRRVMPELSAATKDSF